MARSLLNQQQYRALRRAWVECRAFTHSTNLNRLARIYGTDKWDSHWYTQHYQRYFAEWRKRPLKILEIGVGGYEDLFDGAQSLRMWKRFFPHAQIVGIDLYDKSHFSERRIDVLQCDQTDAKRLTEISQRYGGFDIVIDDGSHRNEHVIQTFNLLFPLLKTPGFYCIEDLQTSYWPTWGAVSGNTGMDLLRSLTDCVNQAERPFHEPSYFDRNITEIAFFHNLCILRKEPNNEDCNTPGLLQKERQSIQANEKNGSSSEAATGVNTGCWKQPYRVEIKGESFPIEG
jgi:cephalosporin hydroxylase